VKRQKVSTFEANDNQDGFKLVKYEQADFLKKYGSIKEATTYEFTLDSKQTRMNLEQIEFKFNGLEFVENPINLAMPIESNELLMDAHGHLIVKHDLFNHDGLTQDGIAEAFIEFAKKENLSFFDCGLPGSKNLTGLYAEAFDEVKYRGLLEKLEISELKLSEVQENNVSFRFDSEFFHKEYFQLLDFLCSKTHVNLSEISSWITQGPNPNFCEPDDFSIPCLTGRNINKGRVNYLNSDFVDALEYKSLTRFQIRSGDTLVTLKGKGSIGKIGYVADERKAIFSRDIGIIRPSGVNHAYVNAFILSKYGQKLIARGETGGTGQSTLTTSYLKSLFVPRFSIEEIIGNLILRSEYVFKKHQAEYEKAETLLLTTLGMADFSPSTENINIKSFKDSFVTTGRLDAEYYQPKYENYIFSYANGWGSLINSCNLKDSNYYPKDNRMYQYIELANIDKSGGITNCTTELGKDLPSRARRKVQSGDVLISSIEGSLSSCAIVSKAFDGALCSTGFYVIDSNKMNSETLLVLFKSELMQNILKQHCSGTILTAINKIEFSNLPIPIIAKNPQIQIADLVQQSFILKAESERLLATAKRAVEIAIETDEQTAMVYINEQTGEKSCTPKN
jgi:restriction endonuclease S subunit